MKGQSLVLTVLLAALVQAFNVPLPKRYQGFAVKATRLAEISDLPFFLDVVETKQKQAPSPAPNKTWTKKVNTPAHKEGVFSPLVYAAKSVIGDEKLNKIRGNVISMHSDAIKSFVETAETEFGEMILRKLFHAADKNGNGQIEVDELEAAVGILGFRWLQAKQIQGIFARAGGAKGYITLEEWMAEAPNTLKTNLMKLAKTNGGDMGLLV